MPGAEWSGGGYQPASQIRNILTDLKNKYGPAQQGWFAGMMVWDIGSAEANAGGTSTSFARDLSSFLKSQSSNGACSANTQPSPSSSTSSTSISTSQTSSSQSSSSTSASQTSSSTSTSSSSTSSSSSAQPSPTSPAECNSCPSQDGYPATRRNTVGVKRCPRGFGIVTRRCDNACAWGNERFLCIGGR